ncbi:MAG TPA: NGG1p interacting factor NIF3 [Nitratifractor sp.]|nr:NGG1p interacting factor NIF3 [Nitratifractor sp.]HHH20780.1 NGG1p interacting factor NIF3 [Nitratifractor sp.]
MYQIYFYVPKESVESVKEAMFQAGAGRVGNYSHCSWQSLGEGQFKPEPGATPVIGALEKLERLAEYRVEMVCQEKHVKEVLQALLDSHPYEEVAYGVVKIMTIEDFEK